MRSKEFQRNIFLENLLSDVNDSLWLSEKQELGKIRPEFPMIFIMGPHRSGTTLMLQWLASLGSIAYPTNLLSRFYGAPIVGSKIQLLLTDKRYSYRDELKFFDQKVVFSSQNGKTTGALSPNEFWYFWRRFFSVEDSVRYSTQELLEKIDVDSFRSELLGISDVFQKPLALKGMMLNYNIDFLDKVFNKAIFICMKRDPISNIV